MKSVHGIGALGSFTAWVIYSYSENELFVQSLYVASIPFSDYSKTLFLIKFYYRKQNKTKG